MKIVSMLLLFAAFAQVQSKPELTIRGRALLDDGRPASQAVVEAYAVGARLGLQSAACDDDGNFRLTVVAPGSYKLEARATGYIMDSRSTSDSVYRVGESVTLRLVKGGVITGRVTDVTDEPLVGVGINLYRVRDVEGNSPRQSIPWHGDVQTDDRGVYRAFGLEPGAYIIGVEVDSGGGLGGRDVPTWYPATTRAAATEVVVHAGEEITNIDIHHRGSTGYAIGGTVSGETETSSPFGGASVLVYDTATKAPIAQGYANSESKSFFVAGIADGEYEIAALVYNQEGEMATSPPRHVSIKGTDVTGVGLKLARFSSLAGRVVIERIASSNPADQLAKCASKNQMEEILIRARSDGRNPRSLNSLIFENNWRPNQIAPDAKGEFTIRSLNADGYRLEADLPGENWYIRSITQPAIQSTPGAAKRTDISRAGVNVKSGEKLSGIEIAIAEGAAGLEGRVVAAKENQKLPSFLRVYLIPAEPTAAEDILRYREILTGKDGSFEFKQIAPGKYFLLARSTSENDANGATLRPAAFDPIQRTQLRRQAEAAKNEIELKICQRVKDHLLKF